MNKGDQSFIHNRNEAGLMDFCVRVASADRIINVVDWANHCGMPLSRAQAIFNNPFNSAYTYPCSAWSEDAALQWRLIVPFLTEMIQEGILDQQFASLMRIRLYCAHQHTFPDMHKQKA